MVAYFLNSQGMNLTTKFVCIVIFFLNNCFYFVSLPFTVRIITQLNQKKNNGKKYCKLKLNKIIMLIITADNYYFNTHLLTLFALSDIEKY